MIKTIKEARLVLAAHGIGRADIVKNTRQRQFTMKQQWLLHEMSEGLDMEVSRLRETLGSDVFDAITLDASHNELQKMYGAVPDDWRSIAKVRTTRDFKQINSARLGGLSNLLTVAENSEYKMVGQTDERVSYTPAKRGVLLSISLEASYNDEIGAFKEQVGMLGKAAKNTLNEFVLGTHFSNNPTMEYDSVVLFHTTHANEVAGALSHATISEAISLALSQTGVASEQIYIRPTFLAVHPENFILANELIRSATLESGATTVRGPAENYLPKVLTPTVLTSPHLDGSGDASDCYLLTDHPCVEVAFVRGQTEPEIMREPEETGRSFVTDSITWKVRHSYGGEAIDHRGAVRIDAA